MIIITMCTDFINYYYLLLPIGNEKATPFMTDLFNIGTKLLIDAFPSIFNGEIKNNLIVQVIILVVVLIMKI